MLYIDPDFSYLFPPKDTFDAIMNLDGENYRQMDGRTTLRFTDNDGAGFFAKLHRGVGWTEILKNLMALRMPIIGARNEWTSITHLHSLGLPTMDLVAYGERGLNPARKQSFLVTRELENKISLEDLCGNWQGLSPTPRFKRDVIAEVARIARLIHTNGINHRDFYICHFLLDKGLAEQQACPQGALYLIDLHRAQKRDKTPRRWVVKDLAGLYFSSMDSGLTLRDALRFIKVYTQGSIRDAVGEQWSFWYDVRDKGKKLYKKIHG